MEWKLRRAGRTIVINHATRATLGDSVTIEPLGEEMFKGKTVPVKVYAVQIR
jgi:hypothetical protein